MNGNDIKHYLVEFKIIQDMHMTGFNDNPDLEKMIFERKRAFENLRNAISIVPSSILTTFKQEADAIIHKDSIFITKLEEHKQELLKKINRSAKGKQLLKGYRANRAQSLRFMNTRG